MIEDLVTWLRGQFEADLREWQPQAAGHGKFSSTFGMRMATDARVKLEILDEYRKAVDAVEIKRAAVLEDVIAILAQAYCDRPGYRGEWLP